MYEKDKNGKFLKEPKSNPRDRIELQIGDTKQKDFYPQQKISRWDNEVNISFRLIEDAEEAKETPTIIEEGDGVIKYRKSKRDCHFYDIDPCQEHPEGACEFEVFLKEKPATNTVLFSINDKGVVYLFQPELTEQRKAEGWSQPENAIRSYAVYAKEEKLNIEGGKEYKNNKLGHIYRPRIVDADGKECWGEIDIDKNILTATIPKEFLDNAVYPVRHAAGLTFGYTTVGVQLLGVNLNRLVGYLATAPSSGNISKISFYLGGGSTTNIKGVLVLASNSNIVANGVGSPVSCGSTPAWNDSTLSGNPAVTNVAYYISMISDASNSILCYSDSDGAATTKVDFSNNYASPATANFTSTYTEKLSIYATYGAAGGGVNSNFFAFF